MKRFIAQSELSWDQLAQAKRTGSVEVDGVVYRVARTQRDGAVFYEREDDADDEHTVELPPADVLPMGGGDLAVAAADAEMTWTFRIAAPVKIQE